VLTAVVGVVAPGVATLTGTVTFSEGAATLGTAPISGGKAVLPWTFTAAGLQPVVAVYSGDTNNKQSAVTVTVNVLQDSTKTVLTSNRNPAVLGQSIMFTATISVVAPGAGSPTGGVAFKDGTTILATVPVSGGVASFSTSTLGQGAHTITASFLGDVNDLASNSGGVSAKVLSATTVGVSSSSSSAANGTPVTFIATVADVAPGSGVPTGTVTFLDGTTPIKTVALVGGAASLKLSTLAVGSHTITVMYNGDPTHRASTSSAASVVIN
jgi:hypothetical protein